MSKKVFKRSELADNKYYREHRAEILEAMREPGRPRIVDDIHSRGAINERNRAAESAATQEIETIQNLYQPQVPMSFKRSDIAKMNKSTYMRLQPAILAAQRGENGAKIIDDLPKLQFAPSVTIFENERAYIESGGEALQRARDKAVTGD